MHLQYMYVVVDLLHVHVHVALNKFNINIIINNNIHHCTLMTGTCIINFNIKLYNNYY